MMNVFKPKHIGLGYMLRWHLIPRNRFFNVYLHKFIGDDDDRALHDHPWNSISFKLKGQLFEYIRGWNIKGEPVDCKRRVSFLEYRHAEFAHRLEIINNKPAWTIFITGPRKREWGFHCPKGWQHSSTMTNEKGETIGGCE